MLEDDIPSLVMGHSNNIMRWLEIDIIRLVSNFVYRLVCWVSYNSLSSFETLIQL